MRHLERRISALESKDRESIRFIWRNAGETSDEAISRVSGILVNFVTVIGWLDPVFTRPLKDFYA